MPQTADIIANIASRGSPPGWALTGNLPQLAAPVSNVAALGSNQRGNHATGNAAYCCTDASARECTNTGTERDTQ
jgi:hypothetical protein